MGGPHSSVLPQLPHHGLHPRALLHRLLHCVLVSGGGTPLRLHPRLAALLPQTVQRPPAHVQTLRNGPRLHTQVLTTQTQTQNSKTCSLFCTPFSLTVGPSVCCEKIHLDFSGLENHQITCDVCRGMPIINIPTVASNGDLVVTSHKQETVPTPNPMISEMQRQLQEMRNLRAQLRADARKPLQVPRIEIPPPPPPPPSPPPTPKVEYVEYLTLTVAVLFRLLLFLMQNKKMQLQPRRLLYLQ